jgi:hypothetical protein
MIILRPIYKIIASANEIGVMPTKCLERISFQTVCVKNDTTKNAKRAVPIVKVIFFQRDLRSNTSSVIVI